MTVASSRWAGVGISRERNTVAAARSATQAALAGRADSARLVVVFSSLRRDLDELLESVNEVTGGVPLIGCSTAGEIALLGPADESVVVFALGGDGFDVTTTVARGISGRIRSAGAEIAATIPVTNRPHQALLVLSDALAGNQEDLVRGVYSVVGASIPLVGGCAGDDLMMEATAQFFGSEVLSDAIVAAVISSDGPIGIGVRHGWRPVGAPMLVTRSNGERILELDGRPALDVYLERLNAPSSAATDGASFTRFALHHPLGLSRRRGEAHARFIGEADFDARALVCMAAISEGSSVWLMEGDKASVLGATRAACTDAVGALSGAAPVGVLAFDCIARRGVLGEDGIVDEIRALREAVGDAPVAGFYTYGEIARTNGVSGFHNETLVVLALG